MMSSPMLQRTESSKFIEEAAAHGGENQGLMLIPNEAGRHDWP